MIMTDLDDIMEIDDSEYYMKLILTEKGKKAMRSDAEIEKRLMSVEDMCVNKDGWKFKESKGKIFIIMMGLPFLVHNNLFGKKLEASAENFCGVIFHEIGHNFQHVLHGANQSIVDSLISNYLINAYSNSDNQPYFFAALDKILEDTAESPTERFKLIREFMLNSADLKYGSSKSKVSAKTRDESGQDIKEETGRAINVFKRLANYTFSGLLKFVIRSFATLFRFISICFAPLTVLMSASRRLNLNKNYYDTIKTNKQYEQFADSFAVSYGFDISSDQTLLIKNRVQNHGSLFDYYSFINHIPILGSAVLLEEIRCRKFEQHLLGYDTTSGRVANMYTQLQHELQNNKDLSGEQRREIIENVEKAKKQFDKVVELEIEATTRSTSLARRLMKKVRNGDIDRVGTENGVAELVLEVVDDFEKTGKIKEPEVMTIFKDDNDLSLVKKLNNKVSGFFDFVKSKFGIKVDA